MKKIFILFAIAINCSINLSCSNTNASQIESKRNLQIENDASIHIKEIELQTFPLQLHSNGIIKAQQQTQLFFKNIGEIDKISINNGSVVEAGQILAVLDNRQAKMAVQQAKDQLKKANFALNKLLIEYGGKDLDTTSIKPRFLESIKIQSGYYEALTNLQSAEIQYENTFLKAPYSGVIANLKTKEHNQSNMNEPFCTILDNRDIAIEAFILESELSIVQLGQLAKIQPLAYTDKSYTGKVYEINPQVNQQGLIAIKVLIEKPDRFLMDGMNVKLVIEKQLFNQLVISKSAIVDRSGRKTVFTYEEGHAKWNYVTIGYENEKDITIAEGLKAGDKVIVDGNLNLEHETKVDIKMQND